MVSHKALLDKWGNDNLALKENLFKKHGSALKWVQESGKNAAIGSLGALVMLTSSGPKVLPVNMQTFAQTPQNIDKRAFLISDLTSVLPKEVVQLDEKQEAKV